MAQFTTTTQVLIVKGGLIPNISRPQLSNNTYVTEDETFRVVTVSRPASGIFAQSGDTLNTQGS
jgi:hypothetical protein